MQIVSRPQYTSWSNTRRDNSFRQLDSRWNTTSMRRVSFANRLTIFVERWTRRWAKNFLFTLNSPPHPSSSSNRYPSIAGPRWPAHPTIPCPGGGCQATVTLLFSALHSSGINIGAPGATKIPSYTSPTSDNQPIKSERKKERNTKAILRCFLRKSFQLPIESLDTLQRRDSPIKLLRESRRDWNFRTIGERREHDSAGDICAKLFYEIKSV